MRKLLLLLGLFIFSTIAFAQSNYQDVIYLKGGNVYKGMIIEQVPNVSFKIKTEDGNVFTVKIDEIEKITKVEHVEKNEEFKGKSRKGYVGFSVGYSIAIQEFGNESNGLAEDGVQLNFVNLGYLFSENIGIAGSFFGSRNPTSSNNSNSLKPWEFLGFMIGPLVSFQLSSQIEWDFRPLIGYSLTSLPIEGERETSALAISLGTMFRFHLDERFSLLFSGEYYSSTVEFDVGYSSFNGFPIEIEQKIETITIGIGLVYRLK